MYPGRASISQSLDLLITLLHFGRAGWVEMLRQRKEVQAYLINKIHTISENIGEVPIIVEGNDISFGITLNSLGEGASLLGAMLFQRCASGARVLYPGVEKAVAGVTFKNFGTSHDEYPNTYLTVAAALGTTSDDVDGFFERFLQCLEKYPTLPKKK